MHQWCRHDVPSSVIMGPLLYSAFLTPPLSNVISFLLRFTHSRILVRPLLSLSLSPHILIHARQGRFVLRPPPTQTHIYAVATYSFLLCPLPPPLVHVCAVHSSLLNPHLHLPKPCLQLQSDFLVLLPPRVITTNSDSGWNPSPPTSPHPLYVFHPPGPAAYCQTFVYSAPHFSTHLVI